MSQYLYGQTAAVGVGSHAALWVLGSGSACHVLQYLIHQAFPSYCLVLSTIERP